MDARAPRRPPASVRNKLTNSGEPSQLRQRRSKIARRGPHVTFSRTDKKVWYRRTTLGDRSRRARTKILVPEAAKTSTR